jgi:hypothetical protein
MPSARRKIPPRRPEPKKPASRPAPKAKAAAAKPKKPVPKPASKPAAKLAPKPAVKPVPPKGKAPPKPAPSKEPLPELAVPLPGGRRHVLSLSFVRDGDEFLARLETDAGHITELKNRSLDQLLTLVAGELEDLLD